MLETSGTDGAGGGRIEVRSDENITLAAGSEIRAEGSGAADGGQVYVVAEKQLDFQEDALVDADGGEEGSGGFVELSGYEHLVYRGDVEATGGTLLLDPTDVLICDGAYGSCSPPPGTHR